MLRCVANLSSRLLFCAVLAAGLTGTAWLEFPAVRPIKGVDPGQYTAQQRGCSIEDVLGVCGEIPENCVEHYSE